MSSLVAGLRSSAPVELRLSLDEIRAEVVFKAMSGGFYSALRTFFRNMRLQWGDCATACAYKDGRVSVIELGRVFFATHVLTASEAAEITLHELLHHIFGHLDDKLAVLSYSARVRNLAMDAIINAYLHKAGCTTFMHRFYRDEFEFAYLRSDSHTPMLWKSDAPSDSAFKRWQDAAMKRCRARIQCINPNPANFYERLYKLEVTLEESLAFFQVWFPELISNQDLLGNHEVESESEKSKKSDKSDSKADSEKADDSKTQSQESTPPSAENQTVSSSTTSGDAGIDSVLTPEEASGIMSALGMSKASPKTVNNFHEIIRSVVNTRDGIGDVRSGYRLSRRMPTKLRRQDLLNCESNKQLFRRTQFASPDFALFIDVSGSVAAYIPFAVGLVQRLQRLNHPTSCFVWATTVQHVEIDKLENSEVDVGSNNTVGEAVALEIAKHKFREVLILTDNLAGDIHTSIKARVHLCLTQGGVEKGSFANTKTVPDCNIYRLEIGA